MTSKSLISIQTTLGYSNLFTLVSPCIPPATSHGPLGPAYRSLIDPSANITRFNLRSSFTPFILQMPFAGTPPT